MKKTILFKTMLLLCALIVGSSSAWAEEVTYVFQTNTWGAKIGDTDANWTSGKNGAAFSNNGVQVTAAASGANATSPISYDNISKIVVTYNTNKSAGAGTFSVKIGDNDAVVKDWGYTSGDGRTANYTLQYDYETPQSGYVTITAKTTTNSIYVVSIAITYGDSNPATATTVTIDGSGITNTNVYEGTAAGKLSATVKAGENPIEGATVTWTSSNTGVATIDEKGSVTLVAAGTTTITASYAGIEDVYKSSSDTYELTVTNSDPNAPGTENNPYTVAQARAAIDAGTGIIGVYATGIVSEIVTPYNSQFGNISYNISVDGTTSADQLQAFRGKSFNGEKFTSEDDIQVGDVVVIYGNLKKHNSIYEFDADNQLVSLDRPIVSTITVAETSIDVPVEGGDGTINVTYDNFNDIVADIAFYEADGTTPATYDWIKATINDENNIEYVVVENDGPSRKAYLKVYALDDNTEEVYSELITITQAKFVPAPTTNTYTLTTTVVPGRHYIIVSGEDNGNFYAMGAKNTNNRATVKITVNEGKTTISPEAGVSEFLVNVDQDGYFTIYDYYEEGYLYAAGGTSSNYLRVQTENDKRGQWMITFDENGVATVKANTSGRNWMRYNKSSSIFSCYGSGQQDIFLYERDGDTGSQNLTVNISDACTDGEKFYTTYSAPFAYQITGATVYGVSIEEGKLSLNEITADAIIPAYSGVLISSDEPGAKDIVTAKGGAALQNDVNWLLPTLWGVTADDMTGDNLFYRLTMHNGTEIGFWWGAADGAAFNLAANKAYLAVPKDVEAREGWWFDSETTGIKTVENAASSINGEVYNLAGQRVAQPAKGLYIVNGKKVVVK